MTDQEINEAVARKLGFKPNSGQLIWENDHHVTFLDCEMPNYSTDIGAAWEIVEHLRKTPCYPTISIYPEPDSFSCSIVFEDDENPDVREKADTAPMAICKAFLKLP